MAAGRDRGPARVVLVIGSMPNDQYKLGELLGRGGMGQVHSARHRSGRVVAVKRVRNTLSGDRLIVARLTDEACLLGTVSHPNVVRALDHGIGADGLPFLVMDRAYGTPLNELIAEHGPLSIERTLAIAAQLFAGLTAIHDAQVVHADLKSHNILVDDIDIVTIIDFGLARTLGHAASDGLIAGTPAYMAPELITGATPSVTGDIYAAGAIAYEMLTGTTPFFGQVSEILDQQLAGPVEPPSRRAPELGISTAIDRVVMRALDASPGARYQTVRELAAAFSAASDHWLAPLAVGSDAWADHPTVTRPALRPDDGATDRQARSSLLISASLTHAQQLIEDHRVDLAAEALEAALTQLLPALDTDAPCAEVWRIETVLAALYDSIGRHDRARRMALVAYRHALHTACPLAERRASVLVDRLVARSRRGARGSSSPR